MPDPQVLGALYAILGVLALLVLVGIAAVLALWSWLRAHESGDVHWNRHGFAVKANRPEPMEMRAEVRT